MSADQAATTNERKITTAELCEVFDVDTKTVTRWVSRGLPCDRRGKRNDRFFSEAEVAGWLKENKLTTKPGTQATTDDKLAAAKLRKELALAERHEINLAKDKGLLVDRAEVERSNCEKFATIRNRLLGLPASVAPLLEPLSAPEIQFELERRITEALSELSKS